MDSAVLVSIITAVGTIIIALINRNTNKKVTESKDSQVVNYNELREELINKINNNKEEVLKGIKENSEDCAKKINAHILENDKTYLTDFLSDIESDEPKKEIQIRRAYEIKREYNLLGGDSYIDDKWDELVKKGILKEREERK